MAANSVKKAQELMAKGEKCLTKFSFFGSGTGKFEDAAECFNDAGKMFVMGKAYDEGATAYKRAADCHLKAKGEFDAAASFGKAGEAYQKSEDVSACAGCYRESAAIYGGMGKCSMAANMSKKLAEVLEQGGQPDEVPAAIEAYQQAIDYYDGENQPMRANGCREKVAFLSATLGAYDDALGAFDALGRSCLASNLGKFNAKKWFTNAILCALAREDVVKAKNCLAEYANLDYTFVGTREHMLCEALCAACDENSDEAVATAAADYDKIKRLDPWTTKMLLAIKDTCSGMEPPAMPDVAPEDIPDTPDEADADELPDLT